MEIRVLRYFLKVVQEVHRMKNFGKIFEMPFFRQQLSGERTIYPHRAAMTLTMVRRRRR